MTKARKNLASEHETEKNGYLDTTIFDEKYYPDVNTFEIRKNEELTLQIYHSPSDIASWFIVSYTL